MTFSFPWINNLFLLGLKIFPLLFLTFWCLAHLAFFVECVHIKSILSINGTRIDAKDKKYYHKIYFFCRWCICFCLGSFKSYCLTKMLSYHCKTAFNQIYIHFWYFWRLLSWHKEWGFKLVQSEKLCRKRTILTNIVIVTTKVLLP